MSYWLHFSIGVHWAMIVGLMIRVHYLEVRKADRR